MSFLTKISYQLSLLGRFWQEKINGQVFRWNLIFIFGQLIYLIIRFNDLPPLVPLFFSLSWGEGQLAPASSLFILPTLAIAVLLINNLMAALLLRSLTLLSRLLIIFSLIFSFMSAVSVIRIISLII